MSKLYSPPTWEHVQPIEGSLRYSVTTCTTTYKLAGVWVNVQVTGVGETTGADYIFTTPTVISDALAAEMQSAGVPGTYT